MKRRQIRENVFRLVFCGEFHSSAELSEQVQEYFESEQEDLPAASEEEQLYMTEKFNQIKEHITEIDEKINAAAKGWTTSRMGKAELAILRLAVYEMLYDEAVPVGVAINEAVELAKKYGADEAPAFVNGVLSGLV